MRPSTQLVIRLAAALPFVFSLRAHAVERAGFPLLHTNQGGPVTHSNQEGGWTLILTEPQPLPATSSDPFSVEGYDPWAHGNSPRFGPRLAPRIATPPVHAIPAPGTLIVLGLFLGMPARRRRSHD